MRSLSRSMSTSLLSVVRLESLFELRWEMGERDVLGELAEGVLGVDV